MLKISADKPLGPSELGKGFGKNWNNQHRGVDGPITCEICGTVHPERNDESYIISTFLDKQVVEECCGKLLDVVYRENGEEFTEAFLEEFSDDPTNIRFFFFSDRIKKCLVEAKKRAAKIEKEIGEALEHIS